MLKTHRQGVWVRTDVFAEGQILASYENDGQGVHFHLTDWLGTRRVQTDYAGNAEVQCQGGAFGDALICSPLTNNASDATSIHFTGKERDGESGNDYFGARYYSSNFGRFMSPDWGRNAGAVPYADLDNPQSLNLYSYVLGNPLSSADPDGHDGGDDLSSNQPNNPACTPGASATDVCNPQPTETASQPPYLFQVNAVAFTGGLNPAAISFNVSQTFGSAQTTPSTARAQVMVNLHRPV